MKKNILKAILVAAFALIAGFNVYNAQKSDVMSDLALANGKHWLVVNLRQQIDTKLWGIVHH